MRFHQFLLQLSLLTKNHAKSTSFFPCVWSSPSPGLGSQILRSQDFGRSVWGPDTNESGILQDTCFNYFLLYLNHFHDQKNCEAPLGESGESHQGRGGWFSSRRGHVESLSLFAGRCFWNSKVVGRWVVCRWDANLFSTFSLRFWQPFCLFNPKQHAIHKKEERKKHTTSLKVNGTSTFRVPFG